jgi:hypothetical protein
VLAIGLRRSATLIYLLMDETPIIINNTFCVLVASVVADYSMYRVDGGISLHLSKMKVCFSNHKNILVLGMQLVICWSTFY